MGKGGITELELRLIEMPCCGYQCLWVNPHLPSKCPECGQVVYLMLQDPYWIHAVKGILTLTE